LLVVNPLGCCLDDLNSSIYWGMEVVIRRRRRGGKREERGGD
jgi:hypothetical protein